MIFVTVGSQKFQFNRLLKKVDQLVYNHTITEEVYAQTGVSDYVPRYYQYQSFFDRDSFIQMIDQCSILITHGGTSTIIDAINRRKKVLVVPRLVKYGEHVDDHQLQLLTAFASKNLICPCPDVENLPEAFRMLKTHQYVSYISNTEAILKSIDTFIQSL